MLSGLGRPGLSSPLSVLQSDAIIPPSSPPTHPQTSQPSKKRRIEDIYSQLHTHTASAGEGIDHGDDAGSEDQYDVGGEYTEDEVEEEDEAEEEEEEEESEDDAADNTLDFACSQLSSAQLDIAAKLKTVLRVLIAVGWSLPNFLKALVREHDRYGNDILLDIHKWRTCSQRRGMVSRAISQAELFELNKGDLRVSSLLDEFEILRKQAYFGKFDETADIETLDFDAAAKIVESTAPLWHHTLTRLLQNQRYDKPSYKKAKRASKIQRRPAAIYSTRRY
jgi:hypothetical protein